MIKRYIEVKGNDYERGFQIGKELRDQILTNYNCQKEYYSHISGKSYEEWMTICKKYIPYIQEYTPHIMDELQGMADGAQLPLEQILCLTTAYEKSFSCDLISDKCTAFAAMNQATTDGRLYCGQTNDERVDEWRQETDAVIHHVIPETETEILLYTHPGVLAYMGMNNHGLGVLWTYIDNGDKQDGLPTNVIIRELLNKKTLAEAREFLYHIPHALPNHFLLCREAEGIYSFECFPGKVYEKHSVHNFAHANHNIIALTEPEKAASMSSYSRQEAMEEELQLWDGKIDQHVCKDILSSHRNFDRASICNHPTPQYTMSKTLAALYFDLRKGEFHITFGNPCECKEFTYYLRLK